MADALDIEGLSLSQNGQPRLTRSYTLNFIGDWGGANFHRICGWLTQEFCERASPKSRIATFNHCGGGLEGIAHVNDGEADLAIATPATIMRGSINGTGMFYKPFPCLQAIGVLP